MAPMPTGVDNLHEIDSTWVDHGWQISICRNAKSFASHVPSRRIKLHKESSTPASDTTRQSLYTNKFQNRKPTAATVCEPSTPSGKAATYLDIALVE
ncbi:hypothetical protein PHLCEN_2v5654 [Hermanssonia centrifuga]|uniref:Uncharacterized protein n=1 Tax=Hermanssonia centrifuga TaxID=98765 RepID=A0A2R6P1P3_9APHY|nr:hypothetical protein PHLCEN_2v5654 [Hermanssonia centrifuga]